MRLVWEHCQIKGDRRELLCTGKSQHYVMSQSMIHAARQCLCFPGYLRGAIIRLCL